MRRIGVSFLAGLTFLAAALIGGLFSATFAQGSKAVDLGLLGQWQCADNEYIEVSEGLHPSDEPGFSTVELAARDLMERMAFADEYLAKIVAQDQSHVTATDSVDYAIRSVGGDEGVAFSVAFHRTDKGAWVVDATAMCVPVEE